MVKMMKNKIVVIYTMDDCSFCLKAKRILEHRHIQYVSYNIKPYLDRPYPYFNLNNVLYEYVDIARMIKKVKKK